ncbi:MAG: hypothetical protein ACI9CO_001563 [Candidatus Azotimanducaceae bacterium]|jgi:hypothetical protein
MGLFQASCLPPFGPAKAFQNASRQFCNFLGYYFKGCQLTVAKKTVEKHVIHWYQLYEQQKKERPLPKKQPLFWINMYRVGSDGLPLG